MQMRSPVHTEWIETNGIGGYASGVIDGPPARRYHGLLIAAVRPPTHRAATLFGMTETADQTQFSAHAYPGVHNDRETSYLTEFGSYPFPTWIYNFPNGTVLQKTIAMLFGENTALLIYRHLEGPELSLALRPRLVWRDYHGIQQADGELAAPAENAPEKIVYQPNETLPPLTILHNSDQTGGEPYWYYRNHYETERQRGFNHLEDHWSPVEMRFQLQQGGAARLIATMDEQRAGDSIQSAPALLRQEGERRQRQRLSIRVSEALSPTARRSLTDLAQRADDFLVQRSGGQWTILAGYPWFTDWGRDTMISLPGIAAARGKMDAARSVITGYAQYSQDGLIPNRFPDDGEEPQYNSADAALWLFEAIRQYADQRPDDPIIQNEWYPLLCATLEQLRAGTRYGIGVDKDGLFMAGEENSQLTWMDAKADGTAVTPRIGKPVELNALWHNALRVVEQLSTRYGQADIQRQCKMDAERTGESFRKRFPKPDGGGLFDVIDGPNGDDPSVRPNQIFAVSLRHRMLDQEAEQEIVQTALQTLFTPVGMRSLEPSHPDYRPEYAGGPAERDSSYHQGTVWAWLWGPFVTAYGNAFGRESDFRHRIVRWMNELLTQVDISGVGGVSEIYDAEPPRHARGCPWQAWSCGELLRVAWEEGLLAIDSEPRPEA